MDKKTATLEDELEQVQEEIKKTQSDIKRITSAPSNKEADDKIKSLTAEVTTLSLRV
jgi:hypothetical protein